MRHLEIITVLDCHANVIKKVGGALFVYETPETKTKFDGISSVSFICLSIPSD